MAPGHYIEEAAQYLKDKKHICLGMHFTMNAEWEQREMGAGQSGRRRRGNA